MTEWISVVDKLPPLENQSYFSERVLICEDDYICIGYICWDQHILDEDMNLDITCSLNDALNFGWGFWEAEDGPRNNINPSYWMPLPKPPEHKHYCEKDGDYCYRDENDNLIFASLICRFYVNYCPICGKK